MDVRDCCFAGQILQADKDQPSAEYQAHLTSVILGAAAFIGEELYPHAPIIHAVSPEIPAQVRIEIIQSS